jgi:Domain of unknown function (DUF4188)
VATGNHSNAENAYRLYRRPDLGFLHAESWFARTTIMVQYWRSMDQLLAYAKTRDAAHLPAWQAFNNAVCRSCHSVKPLVPGKVVG